MRSVKTKTDHNRGGLAESSAICTFALLPQVSPRRKEFEDVQPSTGNSSHSSSKAASLLSVAMHTRSLTRMRGVGAGARPRQFDDQPDVRCSFKKTGEEQ